jgi:hypothetical protein
MAVVYNEQGQSIETYIFDKRQSIAVAAKLNTPMLMAVIDRWQALEKPLVQSLPDFNNPAIAARAWADEVEKNQASLIVIKNKDQLLIASNEATIKAGEILVREFVKSNDLIDLGEKQFFDWMRDQGYILKGRTEPYQEFVKRGYFTYKPTEELHGGKFRHQLRVTARGQVWLAAKYMAFLDRDMAA